MARYSEIASKKCQEFLKKIEFKNIIIAFHQKEYSDICVFSNCVLLD